MELFLASVYVTENHLRGRVHHYTSTHLVHAENEWDAKLKVEQHWEDKTVEGSVRYSAEATICETLK
jgi:hypothetical protein